MMVRHDMHVRLVQLRVVADSHVASINGLLLHMRVHGRRRLNVGLRLSKGLLINWRRLRHKITGGGLLLRLRRLSLLCVSRRRRGRLLKVLPVGRVKREAKAQINSRIPPARVLRGNASTPSRLRSRTAG